MANYFKFDPETKALIPGVIMSDTQPENSTTVDPVSFFGPSIWDEKTQTWGITYDEYKKQNPEKFEVQIDPYQQQLSTIANQLLKQNIALSQRVDVLEKEAK